MQYTEERKAYIAKKTEEINKKTAEIDSLKVGDGISFLLCTDVYAGTIIRKTPTQIVVQEDDATLINGDELEFIPGGFSAHCANQYIQKYEYKRNTNNRTFKLTRRTYKDSEGNERHVWKCVGYSNRGSSGNVYAGRRKFHDYNY